LSLSFPGRCQVRLSASFSLAKWLMTGSLERSKVGRVYLGCLPFVPLKQKPDLSFRRRMEAVVLNGYTPPFLSETKESL
jgi:hypothetical protein